MKMIQPFLVTKLSRKCTHCLKSKYQHNYPSLVKSRIKKVKNVTKLIQKYCQSTQSYIFELSFALFHIILVPRRTSFIKFSSSRVEQSVYALLRTRDMAISRYKEFGIPVNWLMDSGIVGKVTSLRLKQNFHIRYCYCYNEAKYLMVLFPSFQV